MNSCAVLLIRGKRSSSLLLALTPLLLLMAAAGWCEVAFEGDAVWWLGGRGGPGSSISTVHG